jgi:hypothetical protein
MRAIHRSGRSDRCAVAATARAQQAELGRLFRSLRLPIPTARLIAIGDTGTDALLGFTGMPEALGEVAVIKPRAARPTGNASTTRTGDAEAIVCDCRSVIGFQHSTGLSLWQRQRHAAADPPTAHAVQQGIEAGALDGRLFWSRRAQDAKRGQHGGDRRGWAELTILRSEGFQPPARQLPTTLLLSSASTRPSAVRASPR